MSWITFIWSLSGAAFLMLALLIVLTRRQRRKQKDLTDNLRESEAKFRRIFENVQDVFYQVDEGGKIMEISPSIKRYSGYSREELIGKPVIEVYQHPEERTRLLKTLRENGEVIDFEVQLKSKTGRLVYVSVNLHSLSDAHGKPSGVEGSMRDITERKRSENLALGQQQIMEMIASDAPLPETLNALLHTIEQQDEELLCSILLLDEDGIHLRHGAAPRLPEAYNKAIDGLVIGAEEGSCGTAAFTCRQVIVEDIATDPLWKNYKSAALPHELRACWSTPIFDETQKVLGTFAIYYRQKQLPGARHLGLIAMATHVASIAIRRQRTKEALKKSESQLLQSQKMEAFGQLAGGVAHDFNNILGIIQIQTSLLESEGGLSEQQKKFANEISSTVERAAALTRQLLLFSRKENFRPRTLDLNQCTMDLVKMLGRTLGENIDFQLRLAPGEMLLHADPGMMDQVLLNLAVNARDAMPDSGLLVIETSVVEFDEASAKLVAQARPGSFVCLSVSDTGHGISPENLDRIFEPFFTTKDVGKGTGLGLATVFGIVQQHQGWVNVQSRINQGTTFKIFLPRLTETSGEKLEDKLHTATPSGTETILLVEDETSLRNSIKKILIHLGYQVLEASSGAKALEVWKANDSRIDLVLTDMVMPDKISGKDLAQRLLKENPTLKVVYMSGYSVEVAGKDFRLHEGVNFLSKPFKIPVLAQTIRNRLDS